MKGMWASWGLAILLLGAPVLASSAAAETAQPPAKSSASKPAASKAAASKAAKAKTSASKKSKSAKTSTKQSTKKSTKKSTRQASAKKKGAATKQAAKRKTSRKMAQARPSAIDLQFDNALRDGELMLRSEAALVINQQTGEALYAKNPQKATPIASITKLMTALVTLDADLALNEPITIDDEDVDRIKGTRSRLPLGAELSRGELLNLALIASENRAAAALSRAYPGGRAAFVAAMNRKALELEMHSTYFVDGTGLSSSNRSTAADLAKLVNAAYGYPLVREITATGQYDVTVPGFRTVKIRQDNGRIKRVSKPVQQHVAFHNTNALTRNDNWDIGISKTGYISEAGHCLVMQTRISGEKVIIVLLDSWGKMSRIGDANRIRRWLESGPAHKLARSANPGTV